MKDQANLQFNSLRLVFVMRYFPYACSTTESHQRLSRLYLIILHAICLWTEVVCIFWACLVLKRLEHIPFPYNSSANGCCQVLVAHFTSISSKVAFHKNVNVTSVEKIKVPEPLISEGKARGQALSGRQQRAF